MFVAEQGKKLSRRFRSRNKADGLQPTHGFRSRNKSATVPRRREIHLTTNVATTAAFDLAY